MSVLSSLLCQFLLLCPLLWKVFDAAMMQIESNLICTAEEKTIELKISIVLLLRVSVPASQLQV